MSTAAVTTNAVPTQPKPEVKICEHIKDDGHRCGSPAIRGRHFCYQHSRAHAPSHLGTRAYRAPIPECIASLQLTIMQVSQALGSGTITEKMAARLLYAVQLSSNLLKMQQPEKNNAEVKKNPGRAGAPSSASVAEGGVVDSKLETGDSKLSDDPMTRCSDEPISESGVVTNADVTRNPGRAGAPSSASVAEGGVVDSKLETVLSPAMAAALAPLPVEPIDEPEPQPKPITRKEYDSLIDQLMTDAQIRALRPVLGDGDANPSYNRASLRLQAHYDALGKLHDAGITEDDPRLAAFRRPKPGAQA